MTILKSAVLLALALGAVLAPGAQAQTQQPYAFSCNDGQGRASGPSVMPILGMLPVCTKTVSFKGTANGQDQVPVFLYDWETVPIVITGVIIDMFEPCQGIQYMIAGNSDVPDVMLETGPGMNYGRKDFPARSGMLFRPDGAHIDLHVACDSGEYQIDYIIEYIPAN